MQYLTEPTRDTPIIARPDVLVVGGGSAGISASVAASRAGAETMLIERYGYMGGLATGGLVILLLTMDDGEGRQVVAGLCQEVVDRLVNMDAAYFPEQREWGSQDEALIEKYLRWGLVWGRPPHKVRYSVAFDPEAFKRIADDLVQEAGVRLLLHTWVTDVVVQDKHITHVVCINKSGRHAIQPKVIIDATGDGDLFAFAGLPHETAEVHAYRWYRMANVQERDQAITGGRGKFFPTLGGNFFHTAGSGRTLMPWGIADHTDRKIDPRNAEDLTYAEIETRRLVMDQAKELRSTIPGFENAYLADMADQLGITETRRLSGVYVLRTDDEGQNFDDTVAVIGNWTRYGQRYYIPYRSLIAPGIENLLVSGRCISVDKRVHNSTKEIPAAMATGQAAGLAAAMSASAKQSVHHMDITALRSALREVGAIIDS